jgi:serine/threonine-protein phosphatase 2A regulatory subunit B
MDKGGENFISCCDSKINLWNLEKTGITYNVVEIPITKEEEDPELISSCQYNPTTSDVFIYSSNKGYVNLCDLRQSTSYPKYANQFKIPVNPAKKHFFTDFINNISHASFTKDGTHILSRDYVSTKIWDVRNSTTPLRTIQFCDYIEKKLCDLYDNERIFDKFVVKGSPCSNYFFTGGYNNSFHVMDVEMGSNTTIEGGFVHKRAKHAGVTRNYNGRKLPALPGTPNLNAMVQFGSWHPNENILAVGNKNCIMLFNHEKKL